MENTLSWQMPDRGLILSVFSPTMTQAIRSSEFSSEVTSFREVILNIAGDFTEVRLGSTFPTDINNFFDVLGPILSPDVKDLFRDRLRHFDEISGWEVSEGFVCRCSFQYWLKYFAGLLIRTGRDQTTSPTASHGYDGISKEPSKSTGKIIQVNLEGPTIRHAWEANTTIVDPRNGATLKKLEDWTPDNKYVPMESGGYTVYHGTAAHLDHWMWPEKWNDDKMNLAGSSFTDQVTPFGIDSVYTAFSPLRAFLWAAFKEHMYRSVPTAADMERLESAWTSAGQSFTGVAVFAFGVSQPKPCSPPMSCSMIPTGKEQEWHDRLMGVAEGQNWHDAREQAWQYMSPIHGSTDVTSWPEVLHAMEYGKQRVLLAPFKANLWRTCWSGTGIDALNSCYLNTMAITFVLTKPSPPEPTMSAHVQATPDNDGHDDDDGRTEGKGSLRGLTKRMSQVFVGKGKGRAKP